jgi:Na+/H+-dicarboxylate symporter
LALWIFIGLIAGMIVGTSLNYLTTPEFIKSYVSIAKYGNIIFLKFIKLIIGPLVLSTLVVGVAGIGDAGTVGRMSVKTIGWFIFASLMSLTHWAYPVQYLSAGLGLSKSDIFRCCSYKSSSHRQFSLLTILSNN